MCDPVSLSIASTVAGAAGSAASSMGAAKAAKKQAREVQSWTQQQSKFRQQEQGRQEELRQGATQAQEAGLAQMAGDAQAKRQADEEARLSDYLQGEGDAANVSGEAPVSEADKAMLSGQNTGEPEFKEHLAKKINEASKTAKQRIGALARVSSYGESFGGLGTTNPIEQQAAGSAIDRQNEFRRGSLGAYNVERAIDPVQVSYTPSPLADIFSTALSVGAQGLGAGGGAAGGGSGWGSLFKSAGKKAADPWGGMRSVSKGAF